MVVSTQELTRPSPSGTTCVELEECPDASLVWASSVEPLNTTSPSAAGRLSSAHMVEGKRDSPGGETVIGRIPVVSADGEPLMPCRPAKARKLLEVGKAVRKWSKVGVFCLQLTFTPASPRVPQPLAVGVDPGSKFEGLSVVGNRDTVLNVMSEAVGWVKGAVTQRRQMRRARRYRKTRRRPCRFDNRLAGGKHMPPSTKARWDAKLRVVAQLREKLPLTHAVVEDVKAETRRGWRRRWNQNFSPLEVGKSYFYDRLRGMSLTVVLKTGVETQRLRAEFFNLKKSSGKSKPVFESHCVDAWCLAASVSGARTPSIRSLYYLVPLRWHRRQLHRFEAGKGGDRRRYGGTISLGLKKGTLVNHTKHGLCYIGGSSKGDLFSLHSLKTGKRVTQNARREDFKILTRIGFRTQFLPPINGVGFLG